MSKWVTQFRAQTFAPFIAIAATFCPFDLPIFPQMLQLCSIAPTYGPCVLSLQLVGVYAIILFHIWPSEFCNGFMGADVLFVVFGFLIGVKMIERAFSIEQENDNTVLRIMPNSSTNSSPLVYANYLARFIHQMRRFYLNEFTQIIPLNLLLILCSLIGGFVFLLDDGIEQLRTDLLWALCFGTNHQLTDVDWTLDLIGISQPRPLLHLWVISVQTQFILAFSPPLILLFGLKSGTKLLRSKFRIVGLAMLFLLFALPSFLLWLFSVSKSVMMGWTCSRAWQILLGTMSAAFIANPKTEQTQKSQMNENSSNLSKSELFSTVIEHSLFYVVSICLAVVFFLPSILWPSFFHYKSVLSISVSAITAFLLYFFTNRLMKKTPPRALCQWLFLNFCQFPLFCFLIHQPLAVFVRLFLIVTQLNIIEGAFTILLITLSSLFVQIIFHKIVSNNEQQKKRLSSLSAYLVLFGYAFCLLFAIAPGSIRLNQKMQKEMTVPIYDDSEHIVQFLPWSVPSVRKFLEQIQIKSHQSELIPLLNSAEKVKINEMLKNCFTFDLNVPGESSDIFVRETNMVEDNRLVKRIYEWMFKGNGTNKVMLFGNSHAQVAWREVAEALEGNFSWLNVVAVPGCMPLFENDWRTIYGIHCAHSVHGLIKVLDKTRPDILLLIFRWYDDLQPPPGEATNLETDTHFNAMQFLMDKVQLYVTKQIFISAPNLQFNTEISHQLAKRIWHNNSLEGLNKNYSKHLEENKASYERLARLRCAKCSVFDLSEEFCWDGICHAFEPNTQLAYFSDGNHLSFLGRLKARKVFEKIAKSIGKENGQRETE